MKVRVWHWAKPMQVNRYQAEQIWIEIPIPFVPVGGMRLKVTPSGQALRVEDVHWDIASRDVIEVFTAQPDRLPSLREMLAQGWRIGSEREAE